MTFPVGVELQINGTWTDLSHRARMVPPTIHRGRPDELSQVAPTTATVVFDNTDGFLTPRNPNSPWYPYIKRGLPARLSIDGGPSYLNLTGATGGRATTPDNAALDITGNLFMAVEIEAPVAIPPVLGTRYQIMAKYNSGTNNRSYYLAVDGSGKIVLFWSTDGTAGTVLSVVSDLSIPQFTAGSVTFSVTFVPSFAGFRLTTFHVIHGSLADLLAALATDPASVQLEPQNIVAGASSIFSSNAALDIGDITGTGDDPYPGRIRRAQVRSGDFTGTIVANPDFTTQTPGTTTFTDSATRAWTVQPDATIMNRQTRFVGTTDAITLDWPKATRRTVTDTGVAHATFTCSGRLRAMAQGAKPLHSSLYRLVASPSQADLVKAYWPLEDGRDSTTLSSPVEGVRPGSILGMDLASDDTLDASEPLPSIGASTLFRWRFDVPRTITVNTNFQSAMMAKIPVAPTSELQLMVVDTSSIQVRTWALQISNTTVRLRGIDHTDTEVVNDTQSADARMFGNWILVAINVTQNGGNIDWDWDIILTPDGFGFGDNGSIAGSCGQPTRLRAGSTTPATGEGFSCGHFIVTTDAATGWLAGADTAWIGETAAHRFYRLCTEEEIPVVIVGDNTLADFFRGNSELSKLMGAQRPIALPELLQECAEVDNGIFYEQRNADGLAFRTGRTLYNQNAAVTLDVNQHGLTEPFEPTLDDQRIRNDVTVTRTEGSSARVTDDTSIADEGVYDEDVTRNVWTDLQLPNHAGWRLHLGTWPELRYPTINTSMLKAGQAITGDWVDTDLGDQMAAANLMRQIDPSTEQLIEGYDETLSLFDWEVGLNGSPAGPWEVGVLNSATLGKLAPDAATLSAGITTTATSLSVATASTWPLWDPADVQDGFDINIGGEQMTVTDISGTTSPQTFTVTRSINGVVKAHSSGAAVTMWRPTVLAL